MLTARDIVIASPGVKPPVLTSTPVNRQRYDRRGLPAGALPERADAAGPARRARGARGRRAPRGLRVRRGRGAAGGAVIIIVFRIVFCIIILVIILILTTTFPIQKEMHMFFSHYWRRREPPVWISCPRSFSSF